MLLKIFTDNLCHASLKKLQLNLAHILRLRHERTYKKQVYLTYATVIEELATLAIKISCVKVQATLNVI